MKFMHLAALGILTIGTYAHAYTILDNTIDVGSEDTYVAHTNLPNSGEHTETTWVNEQLDAGVVFTVKTEDVSVYAVDGSDDLFAFELPSEPEFFLIKNANDDADTVLFENNSEYGWGVFSFSNMLEWGVHLGGLDDLVISHVSEFNGNIPEPGTFGLFAIGLLGVGAARRSVRAQRTKA